ncbi:hypothetical protein [Neobacillus vireti]|uniref:hypothetical protein n=1 Tax=Neobacillus vireti TaxID=220686 RepID=UPI002FFF6DBD
MNCKWAVTGEFTRLDGHILGWFGVDVHNLLHKLTLTKKLSINLRNHREHESNIEFEITTNINNLKI